MVERSLLKDYQGVIQRDPIPPTIFNMFVDAVIWHWVMLVAGEEAGPEGFGQEVQWIAVLFYVDDGLLDSSRPARIQAALDVLAGLFDWVGLWENITKTVGML